MGSRRFFLPVAMLLLVGCTHSAVPSTDASKIAALEKQISEMKPGFGEIMGVVQQHHAKLYFAGVAQNWELAQYQLDEIKEGLEDIQKYYPTFKEVKLSISELMPKMMKASLADVAAAIHKKDKGNFIRTYSAMTNSCNACHQAAEHGFVVIQLPKSAEFTNQKFAP